MKLRLPKRQNKNSRIKYKLIDIAVVIRSKNSGPFELTFDIIFKTRELFELAVEKQWFNKKLISQLYKIDESKIMKIIEFVPAHAIKITIERPFASGAVGETDVYGAQQHAPFLDLEFEA